MKFPHEGAKYRAARNRLLKAEIDLRTRIEAVAALRRKLPAGGEAPEDYAFQGEDGEIKLSQLFKNGNTLVAYNFMYGPKMPKPCPMCTSMLDGLNGNAQHIAERTNLVVIAKSPLPHILEHARSRGWSNLKLLSSERNTYNRDYRGEDEKGGQWPMLNVFHSDGKRILPTWGSEMMAAKEEPGQNARHVDMLWPLWNLLDFTPEGRGKDWYPKLDYRI